MNAKRNVISFPGALTKTEVEERTKRRSILIKVKDTETGKVAHYPSYALCAMDVRTTYPSLCYHLRVHKYLKLYNRYEITEEDLSQRDPNKPLTIQVRNMDTGALDYYPSIRAASKATGVSSQTIKKRFERNTHFFSFRNLKFYRIG